MLTTNATQRIPDACSVGCVGFRGLPLRGGPTGPYLEGVPHHYIKKKKKPHLKGNPVVAASIFVSQHIR